LATFLLVGSQFCKNLWFFPWSPTKKNILRRPDKSSTKGARHLPKGKGLVVVEKISDARMKKKEKKRTSNSFAGSVLRAGGTAAGNLLGGPIGGVVGGAIGQFAGNSLSRLLGSGTYRVKNNSLMSMSGTMPTMGGLNPAVLRFNHREEVGDVFASDSFTSFDVILSPVSFPFSRNMSLSFQKYRPKGFALCFVTSSNQLSASPLAGQVVIAYRYNFDLPAFTTQQEMINTGAAVSTVPYSNAIALAECAPESLPLKEMYIRRPDIATVSDNNTYQWGVATVSVDGCDPTIVGAKIGTLWVTYEFEYLDPMTSSSALVPPADVMTATTPSGLEVRTSGQVFGLSGPGPSNVALVVKAGASFAHVTSPNSILIEKPGFYEVTFNLFYPSAGSGAPTCRFTYGVGIAPAVETWNPSSPGVGQVARATGASFITAFMKFECLTPDTLVFDGLWATVANFVGIQIIIVKISDISETYSIDNPLRTNLPLSSLPPGARALSSSEVMSKNLALLTELALAKSKKKSRQPPPSNPPPPTPDDESSDSETDGSTQYFPALLSVNVSNFDALQLSASLGPRDPSGRRTIYVISFTPEAVNSGFLGEIRLHFRRALLDAISGPPTLAVEREVLEKSILDWWNSASVEFASGVPNILSRIPTQPQSGERCVTDLAREVSDLLHKLSKRARRFAREKGCIIASPPSHPL
jgi:hypothetical protein